MELKKLFSSGKDDKAIDRSKSEIYKTIAHNKSKNKYEQMKKKADKLIDIFEG
jgi:hypothetical protein